MDLKAGARLAIGAVFLALSFAVVPSPARAQAAPPIGHWATIPPTEELYVTANGLCAFYARSAPRAPRRLTVQGSCYWQPSSRGGILTITYPMPLEPGKVRYNIVWINSQTISVWGDIFHLQRG
jgi:hypothetical protein